MTRTIFERARRPDEALVEIEVWESVPGYGRDGSEADLADLRRRKARLEPRWR
jgi:hypothetical protein